MKILAAIQAGGRSARMGTDKAWLELAGRPLIEHVLAAAQPVAERLALVVNAANPQLARYEKLAEKWDAQLLHDLHEQRGPLGGLHTALRNCEKDEPVLILACDLPFLTAEFLSFLLQIHAHETPALTLPLDQAGRPQPLAAIYSANCLPAVEELLNANRLRMDGLYSLVRRRTVAFQEFAQLAGADKFLLNLNSPEDYRKAMADGG